MRRRACLAKIRKMELASATPRDVDLRLQQVHPAAVHGELYRLDVSGFVAGAAVGMNPEPSRPRRDRRPCHFRRRWCFGRRYCSLSCRRQQLRWRRGRRTAYRASGHRTQHGQHRHQPRGLDHRPAPDFVLDGYGSVPSSGSIGLARRSVPVACCAHCRNPGVIPGSSNPGARWWRVVLARLALAEVPDAGDNTDDRRQTDDCEYQQCFHGRPPEVGANLPRPITRVLIC